MPVARPAIDIFTTGGLSIASARHVLAVIDAKGTDLAFAFEAIQHALGATGRIGERSASAESRDRVSALVDASGWGGTALDGLSTIDFTPSDEFLTGYATACLGIAQADLGALTTRDSPELVLELMVVGTVMGDVLMSGLRRLAQESAAATVFPVFGNNSDERREQ